MFNSITTLNLKGAMDSKGTAPYMLNFYNTGLIQILQKLTFNSDCWLVEKETFQ